MLTAEQTEKIEDNVRAAGSMLVSAHVGESEIYQKTGPANYVTDYDMNTEGVSPGISILQQ